VGFGMHLPARAGSAVSGEPPVADAAVWLDDLPAAERPVVRIPPGWQMAARPVAPAAERVPVPRHARLRVRTRSS
jgi:hypothetical protein